MTDALLLATFLGVAWLLSVGVDRVYRVCGGADGEEAAAAAAVAGAGQPVLPEPVVLLPVPAAATP